jgi:hypothetical protein
METMINVLNSFGFKAYLKGNKTFNLTIKGIDNVFNNLFPLLENIHIFSIEKEITLIYYVEQND